MSCDILNLIGFSSVHYYKAKPLTLEAVEIIFSRSRPASVQNSRAVMDIKILILKVVNQTPHIFFFFSFWCWHNMIARTLANDNGNSNRPKRVIRKPTYLNNYVWSRIVQAASSKFSYNLPSTNSLLAPLIQLLANIKFCITILDILLGNYYKYEIK